MWTSIVYALVLLITLNLRDASANQPPTVNQKAGNQLSSSEASNNHNSFKPAIRLAQVKGRQGRDENKNLVRASGSNDISLYSALEDFISDEIAHIERQLKPEEAKAAPKSIRSKRPRRPGAKGLRGRSRQGNKERRRRNGIKARRRKNARNAKAKMAHATAKRHISSPTLATLIGQDPEGPKVEEVPLALGSRKHSSKFTFPRKRSRSQARERPEQPIASSHGLGRVVQGPLYRPGLRSYPRRRPLPFPQYSPQVQPQRAHQRTSARPYILPLSHESRDTISQGQYADFEPSPPDLYRNSLSGPANAYFITQLAPAEPQYHKRPFPTAISEMIHLSDLDNAINYDHSPRDPPVDYGATIFLPIVRGASHDYVDNQDGDEYYVEDDEDHYENAVSTHLGQPQAEDEFKTLYYPGSPRHDYTVGVQHGPSGFSYQTQSIGE